MSSRRALTLLEMMISLAVLAAVGVAVSTAIEGSAGVQSSADSEDALADDILDTWKTLNDDLAQSGWWIPDATQSFSTATLANDRTLYYAPYVYQPQVLGGPTVGWPLHPSLAFFARTAGADLRFEGAAVAQLDRSHLPGSPADRTISPTAPGYRTSYFGPSQELIFVRASSTLWNRASGTPNAVAGLAPSRLQTPLERFPGTTADWQTAANHSVVGALQPSGWQRSGAGWTQVGGGPYGQVMDACYLYRNGSDLQLKLQLEQQAQPDFQSQDPSVVRLYTYAVVPPPAGGNGLGRLVRAYATTGSDPGAGSDPGKRTASDGTHHVVVDKVISENVVRVLFETARHVDDIGITNVRATIWFARPVDKHRADGAAIARCVTMIFAMRAANSWQDKDDARTLLKTSPTIASGAIPFSF